MSLPALRSILFVPGDRPDRYGKALAAGADAVCIDQEDAVAGARKAEAREAVLGFLRDRGAMQSRPDPCLMVRINDLSTGRGVGRP